MSSCIETPFFSIEDRNGEKYVVFFDHGFKKTIYHGTRNAFNIVSGGMLGDAPTKEQIEIAKLFSVPVVTMGNLFVKYLRCYYYDNTDSIYTIRDAIKQDANSEVDDFLKDFSFDYYSTRSRENDLGSLINIGLKNQTDPAIIAEYQEELNIISQLKDNMDKAFVTLMRFCVNEVAEILRRKIDAFNKNEPISFATLYDVLADNKEPVAIRISNDNYVITTLHNVSLEESFFGVYISYMYYVGHYSGFSFDEFKTNGRIPSYAGEEKPSDFGVSLVTDDIKNAILERSVKYIKYAFSPHYAYHTGSITESNGWFSTTSPGTGRCMVDVGTLHQVNPNFKDYFPYDANPSYFSNKDKDAKLKGVFDPQNLTEKQKLNLSPFVYIFSFTAKKWARTLINNISDIQFRTDAFDKLVIDEDIKDLMFSLVDTCNHTLDAGKDIIDNKGGGSIFLLAGNPGCGKTLTAETMSETLQRPLYMVGVGELGTDVVSLEKSLVRVLNTASAWNAILLLDECDIFMEKRQNMDVARNAMVGIFLRLLEYYPGILFLTTNRSNNIDEAFYSRISLAIQYPDLDTQKRLIIWHNILNLYEDNVKINTIDTNALSKININGRQIKNCVRLVLTYCSYKNKIPTTADFVDVLERMQGFQNAHHKHN